MAAWTYSHLDKFKTCPKQYYHLRVKRDFKDPPNVHSEWGVRVHTALEERVRDGTPLPEGMTQWEGIAAKLAGLRGEKFYEHEMAVSKSFGVAPWGDAWSRGILDLLVIDGSTAGIFDHKTGKRKLTNQLGLYAGYVFAAYPEVKTVKTGFIWLKERKIDKEVFVRSDLPTIWQAFLPTVRKLELAHDNNQWPARPSGLCRAWCAVTSCPHNGRKE